MAKLAAQVSFDITFDPQGISVKITVDPHQSVLGTTYQHRVQVFGELLLFTSYVCRQLVNLGEVATRAASVLEQAAKIGDAELLSQVTGMTLVDYQGRGQKGFRGVLDFDPDYDLRFKIHPYGFGLLARNILRDAVYSMVGLMIHLIDSRHDSKYAEAMRMASLMCADRLKDGRLSIATQSTVAIEVATMLMHYYLDPDAV